MAKGATKITLKNAMVYEFLRSKIRRDQTASVKSIYNSHKSEIAKQFGINNYQGFNFHVRKCLNWETSTGNNITVHTLNNKEVFVNE